ncbi:MAG: phosphatase PAP2 family protein [Nocardioidaceae bacterium]
MRVNAQLQSNQARRVGLSALIFIVIAADVRSSGLISSFDNTIREAVQPRDASAASWLGVASDLGELGVAAALLAIVGAVASQILWRLWPIVFAAAVFAVTEGLIYLTKTIVGRDGPGIWSDRTNYPGYYPSGHAATAAVCAGSVVFLAWLSRRGEHDVARATTLGSAVGLLVGVLAAVRSFLGDSHWFSDGVGGLLLAYCILTVAFAAAPATRESPPQTD